MEAVGPEIDIVEFGFRLDFYSAKLLFREIQICRQGTKSDTNLDKSDTQEGLT